MRRPVRSVAALAAVALLAGGCSSTGEPGHTAAVDVVVLDADGVTQTVVPAGDRFDRVTVTTATFAQLDGGDGVLQLDVRGAGEERRTAASGTDLVDNAPVTLAFAPVDGAAGETFELTFTYEGGEPLGLYRNPYDPYPDGELGGAEGDLVFVLGHADRVGGATDALGRIVREAGARATSDPLFLAVWFLALVATAVAGLRLRQAGVSRRRDGRAARRDRDGASR
jgi:hypothetical protein